MPNSKNPPAHQTGNKGELTAAHFLTQKSWQEITKNFHTPDGEIDLIFLDKKNILHFIEVKTRTSNFGGHPENWVDSKKQLKLTKAAQTFLDQNPELKFTSLSFDVIAIYFDQNQAHLKFISPAFDPPSLDQI